MADFATAYLAIEYALVQWFSALRVERVGFRDTTQDTSTMSWHEKLSKS